MRTGKLTVGTETTIIRITVVPVTTVLTVALQTAALTEAVYYPRRSVTGVTNEDGYGMHALKDINGS